MLFAFTHFFQFRFQFADHRQHLLRARHHALAGLVEYQLLPNPVEELHAAGSFQVADLVTQRGLREVELLGGFGYRSFTGDLLNNIEVLERQHE
ncbi:hypothetical protein D3C87_1970940 [compost metagenome]